MSTSLPRANADHAGPYFFRRWKTVLVVVLLIGGAYFAFNYYRGSLDRATLVEALAETDRLYPRWRFEEMEVDRAKSVPADNGGPALFEVASLLSKGFPSWKGLKFPGQTPDTPVEAINQLRYDFETKLRIDLQLPQALNSQQVDMIEAELVSHAKALTQALRLRQFSDGHLDLARGNDLDLKSTSWGMFSNVYVLLNYEVMRQAQHQDWPKAFNACEAMIHAGRCIGNEPDAPMQLQRIVFPAVALAGLERILAQGTPPARELEKFSHVLDREWQEEIFLSMVRGNRAWEHRFYDEVSAGRIKDEVITMLKGMAQQGVKEPEPALFLTRWLHRQPTYFAAHAESLRRHNRLVAIANQPIDKQFPLVQQSLKLPGDPLDLFGTLLLEKYHKACLRTKMKLKMAVAAMAAERYRQDHSRWPVGFDELVPKYLAEPPIDYFDGKQIRWLRLVDGVLLYSVGHDRVELADELRGKSMAEVDDNALWSLQYLFHLWDPAKRRQPPQAILTLDEAAKR